MKCKCGYDMELIKKVSTFVKRIDWFECHSCERTARFVYGMHIDSFGNYAEYVNKTEWRTNP